MPQLVYRNIHDEMLHHVHGMNPKSMFVCHETVSADLKGWADIQNNEDYLASIDYGIHGLTDLEGHKAWAYNLGNAVFYQAGGVNEISDGVENVSPIPTLVANKHLTIPQAKRAWEGRHKQLVALAQIVACWHATDPESHPLKFSDGNKAAGVTTHWNVSQHHPESLGHTDCWPVHEGGYFPVMEVIDLAKAFAKLNYHF